MFLFHFYLIAMIQGRSFHLPITGSIWAKRLNDIIFFALKTKSTLSYLDVHVFRRYWRCVMKFPFLRVYYINLPIHDLNLSIREWLYKFWNNFNKNWRNPLFCSWSTNNLEPPTLLLIFFKWVRAVFSFSNLYGALNKPLWGALILWGPILPSFLALQGKPNLLNLT